jgi:hypothetical protein
MSRLGLGVRPARAPKPQPSVSGELKALTSAIQEQQKTLIAAALGLGLFLVAPRSDELLSDGVAELQEIDASKLQRAIRVEIDKATANPLEGMWAAVLSSKTFAGSPKFQELALQQAELGIVPPQTLKDVVEFTELSLKRCRPSLDAQLLAALSSIADQRTIPVAALSFRAVRDAEASSAARNVSAAALLVEANRRDVDAAVSATAPPAVTRSFPLAPPESLVVTTADGRRERVPNRAYTEWAADRASYQKLKSSNEQATARHKELQKQLKASREGFVASLDQLTRAMDAQLPGDAGAPRSVVLTLAVGPGTALPFTTLDLPANCTQTEIIPVGKRKKLTAVPKSIQATGAWQEVSAVPLELALPVANRNLLKTEQTLNVFGFDVHQRLISRIGPLALAAMMLWHLMHVFRFRSALAASDAQSELATLEKLTPSLPTRRNLPLPFVVASSVGIVSVALAYRNCEDTLSLIGGAAAGALSCALIILTLATRVAATAAADPPRPK